MASRYPFTLYPSRCVHTHAFSLHEMEVRNQRTICRRSGERNVLLDSSHRIGAVFPPQRLTHASLTRMYLCLLVSSSVSSITSFRNTICPNRLIRLPNFWRCRPTSGLIRTLSRWANRWSWKRTVYSTCSWTLRGSSVTAFGKPDTGPITSTRVPVCQ